VKQKVLLQLAVIADVAGVIVTLLHRASTETGFTDVLDPREGLLLAAILVTIVLAEFSIPGKSLKQVFVFALFAGVFCISTFFVSSESQLKDYFSVGAYGSLLLQFTTVLVALLDRKSSLLASFILAGVIFIGATTAGFVYTFRTVWSSSGQDRLDAAVVLGASVWGKEKPSPLLQGRLDAAVQLFKSGETGRLVVTGGTRRFGTVESAVEAAYLEQNGVPDSAIIKEEYTQSTSDQSLYIRKVLMDSLKMNSIAIVTDGWHLPRALLICRLNRFRVSGIASSYKLPVLSEIYYRVRESVALQVYLLFGA